MTSEKTRTTPNDIPFETYVKTGLSSEEVSNKLKQYGLNDIPEKKVSSLRKFMGYFWGPIPWMIEIASSYNYNYRF